MLCIPARSAPYKPQIARNHPSRILATRVALLTRIVRPVEHHDIRIPRIHHAIPVQVRWVARHPRLILDALVSADGFRAIVARARLAVEEGPECRAVEVEVGSAVDVLRGAHAAGLVVRSAPGEIGIAEAWVGGPGPRGVLLRSNTLPVCGLRLLQPGKDVLCIVEVVIV